MVAVEVLPHWRPSGIAALLTARLAARAPLTHSYADPEVALNTGMILKEMLRYEPLAKILLYSEQ